MKRFHVHLHVADLNRSVVFYSQLFGLPPTRLEADYAKWMLDDPRLNFAISTRGEEAGVNYFGFQTDTGEELAELKAQSARAELALVNEGEAACCYARSEKHWIMDPSGLPWEFFHTLGDIPVFGEAPPVATSGCCAPAASVPVSPPKSSCC
jgi:catechol 2,3-dioxygenase-like lactoylglutathione lyase family enzyme